MRRVFVALIALVAACSQADDELWLGLFMNGSRLGYSRTSVMDDQWNGTAATSTTSLTVIQAGMLGSSLDMRIDAKTWSDAAGKPLEMNVAVSSAGRTQRVVAKLRGNNLVCNVDNAGAKSVRTLTVPSDGRIVDDSLTALLLGGSPTGAKTIFYVLDPMTVTLVRNEAKIVGPRNIEVRGKTYSATLVQIDDPRASTEAYVSSKGDLIKAVGPLGIEMYPVSREEALKPVDEADRPDLVDPVAIPILGDTDAIPGASKVKLKITGKNLGKLPSDAHQTVQEDAGSWIVDIHPVTEKSAKTDQTTPDASFLAAGSNIPSDSVRFLELSKKVVGANTAPWSAARSVSKYVYGQMRPNGGIGVLRDASEILDTKEGVCRDYAVLTATLLRASKIPAKLVAGLVQDNGKLYYHAWVEAWDGSKWFGVDSTRPSGRVSAGHLKLAEGSVETAFLFPVLDNVKVELLDAE